MGTEHCCSLAGATLTWTLGQVLPILLVSIVCQNVFAAELIPVTGRAALDRFSGCGRHRGAPPLADLALNEIITPFALADEWLGMMGRR